MIKTITLALGMKNFMAIAISVFIIFLLVFAVLFFAYFYPVQQEHSKIAKLPSHDLSLFQNEKEQTICNSSLHLNGIIMYDGEVVNNKDDLFRLLNNDKLKSWGGRYNYFYDKKNNLFLVLDLKQSDLNKKPWFSILEYNTEYSLGTDSPPPITRALKLGPPIFIIIEMIDADNSESDVFESRRIFIYNNFSCEKNISALSASLQIAIAFTLYLIPIVLCVTYFSKKAVLITAGLYVLLFIINATYYLLNYSWLHW